MRSKSCRHLSKRIFEEGTSCIIFSKMSRDIDIFKTASLISPGIIIPKDNRSSSIKSNFKVYIGAHLNFGADKTHGGDR